MPFITDDASRMPEFIAVLERAILTIATSRASDVPEDEDAYASREWETEDEASSMSVTMSADMVVVRSQSTTSPSSKADDATIHLKTDGSFHPHEPRCSEFVTSLIRRWIRSAHDAIDEASPEGRDLIAALRWTAQRICVEEEAVSGATYSGVRFVCDEIGKRHRVFLLPPAGVPFRLLEGSSARMSALSRSPGLHSVIRCPDPTSSPMDMWTCCGAVMDCLTDEIDVITRLRLLRDVDEGADERASGS